MFTQFLLVFALVASIFHSPIAGVLLRTFGGQKELVFTLYIRPSGRFDVFGHPVPEFGSRLTARHLFVEAFALKVVERKALLRDSVTLPKITPSSLPIHIRTINNSAPGGLLIIVAACLFLFLVVAPLALWTMKRSSPVAWFDLASMWDEQQQDEELKTKDRHVSTQGERRRLVYSHNTHVLLL